MWTDPRGEKEGCEGTKFRQQYVTLHRVYMCSAASGVYKRNIQPVLMKLQRNIGQLLLDAASCTSASPDIQLGMYVRISSQTPYTRMGVRVRSMHDPLPI